MNQSYFPFYGPINQNNLEQILLRIEQELKRINSNLEKKDEKNYMQKDDNLYILWTHCVLFFIMLL